MSADLSTSNTDKAYFQSVQPAAALPAQLDTQSSTTDQVPTTDAAAKLAEAIDDFLGDLEKKFKGISDEVLNKLDDMAERCDRLEAELLAREAVSDAGGQSFLKDEGQAGPA